MSKFTELGLVWANGEGLLLVGHQARKIVDKPKLSFKFDSLYCEPTLSHLVLNGFDKPLTDKQVKEVLSYLEKEGKKPIRVNGVNKEGRLLKNVLESEVYRIVNSLPPDGVWRLDMSKSPEEYWYQPICVDNKTGIVVSRADSEDTITVVPSKPPEVKWNENWVWDFKKKKWVNTVSEKDIIEFIKAKKIEQRHLIALSQIESGYIKVLLNENEYQLGLNNETKMALTDFIQSKSAKIDWYFKGATIPVTITQKEAQNLLVDILDARNKIMDQYFAHKAEIKLIDTLEEIENY